MGIRLVDPKTIPLRGEPAERDVRFQAARLQKEGQIEPILLLSNGYTSNEGWPYADAQIAAAVRLGWETILVTP